MATKKTVNAETLEPHNYQQRMQAALSFLDKTVFSRLADDDIYSVSMDELGNEKKTKKRVRKNEIMPTLTPQQVYYRLDSYLRHTLMMTPAEARELSPEKYLEGNYWFEELMFQINLYVIFNANKQLLCAFLEIDEDTYAEFLTDSKYDTVFKSIESSFIGGGFVASESGLSDTKAVINRLQTKGAGHNLIKNPDNITIINHNKLDDNSIQKRLDRIASVVGLPMGTKKAKKGD
jgi:hypothetical protein